MFLYLLDPSLCAVRAEYINCVHRSMTMFDMPTVEFIGICTHATELFARAKQGALQAPDQYLIDWRCVRGRVKQSAAREAPGTVALRLPHPLHDAEHVHLTGAYNF